MKITIFANTFYLVSGGDVIFAELAKRWQNTHQIKIITNEKGRDFCFTKGISSKNIITQKASWIDPYPLIIVELFKSLVSLIREIFSSRNNPQIIFATSFFWPDIFPAVIAKIKNPRSKLVVGVYLLFPSPSSFKKYHGGQLKLFFLYFVQKISLFLVHLFANLVLTASAKDLRHFPCPALAVRGGIDLSAIKKAKTPKKKYHLIYFGRFHSQKGILDLLTIWQKVAEKLPAVKFLMIGGGSQEQEIKEKATSLKIISKITFAGVINGSQKYRLIKSSKLFTSASRFDTGNIALDEVLACGIPGIVYNLPHLHYPAGVVKVKIGSKSQMVKEIINLLRNSYLRNRLGKQGKEFIKHYDWQKISTIVLKNLSQI